MSIIYTGEYRWFDDYGNVFLLDSFYSRHIASALRIKLSEYNISTIFLANEQRTRPSLYMDSHRVKQDIQTLQKYLQEIIKL